MCLFDTWYKWQVAIRQHVESEPFPVDDYFVKVRRYEIPW